MEDSIAAISTPLGVGGIAIIRISGLGALGVGDAVFVSRHGKPSQFPTHTIHYGKIVQDDVVLDQVMVAVFLAPHSYTTEDIVEIHCHGGVLTAQAILSLCLQHGARLAEPGEFTKRAFLNGRIDLTQAEAVMDLISAQTQRSQVAAAHALEGHLSDQIEIAYEKVANLLASLEARLDFPEEDLQFPALGELSADLQKSISLLQGLLDTAREGFALRKGVPVAIIGRPNAGKSSVMNALLRRARSIVTPIAGTTRDSVEDVVAILGLPVRLTDTAGYRSARGIVESEGIRQTLSVLGKAEIIVHIIDTSRSFSPLDLELMHLYGSKSVIHAYNKIDLPCKLRLPSAFQERNPVWLSALTGEGVGQLRDALAKVITSGFICSSAVDVVVNARQADALRQALYCLASAEQVLGTGDGIEIASQQLRLGLTLIGEISGKTISEDILNRIFNDFCIGK